MDDDDDNDLALDFNGVDLGRTSTRLRADWCKFSALKVEQYIFNIGHPWGFLPPVLDDQHQTLYPIKADRFSCVAKDGGTGGSVEFSSSNRGGGFLLPCLDKPSHAFWLCPVEVEIEGACNDPNVEGAGWLDAKSDSGRGGAGSSQKGKENLNCDNMKLDGCVPGRSDYPRSVCSSPVFSAGVNCRKLGQWEIFTTISEKIPSMVNGKMSDKTNGAINGWSELAESNLLWQFYWDMTEKENLVKNTLFCSPTPVTYLTSSYRTYNG